MLKLRTKLVAALILALLGALLVASCATGKTQVLAVPDYSSKADSYADIAKHPPLDGVHGSPTGMASTKFLRSELTKCAADLSQADRKLKDVWKALADEQEAHKKTKGELAESKDTIRAKEEIISKISSRWYVGYKSTFFGILIGFCLYWAYRMLKAIVKIAINVKTGGILK